MTKLAFLQKKLFAGLFLLGCMVAAPDLASAQEHDFVKNKIKEKGECRNVVITKEQGNIMLWGFNGWTASGCPKPLTDALTQYTNKRVEIRDVQLTEEGNWIIIIDDNGSTWSGLDESLTEKIKEYNDNGENLLTVTMNDKGDWIVISDKHISTSNHQIEDMIKDGLSKFGPLWTACITNEAVIVVFENGYKMGGQIPESLKEKLREGDIDVHHIKISGDAWFISDKKGNYAFDL